MIRWLILFCVLSAPAWATPSFVQAGHCTPAAAATCSVTLGSNTTAGNVLYCYVFGTHGDTMSCSDGSSDSFTTATTQAGSSASGDTAGFQATGIAGGTTSVTCNVASGTKTGCVVLEISGVNTRDANATANVITTATTSFATNTFSTTHASEIVIACFGAGSSATSASTPQINSATATIPTNGDVFNGNGSGICQYQIESATFSSGTGTVTVGTAKDYVGNAISYYQSSGTNPLTQPFIVTP